MTNNTTNENDKQELTSYERLLKNLDDWNFALEFRNKTTERAKELLTEIFMVTSGAFVKPKDNDWAQKHLLELFEFFMIRHKNFDRSTFAEDLQRHLFTKTFKYDDYFRDWFNSAFAERGLDERGIELEKSVEQSHIADEPETEQSEIVDEPNGGYMEELNTEGLALALSGILNNPDLPVGIYNGLVGSLDDVFNDLPSDANEELSEYQNSPEYLTKLFRFSQKSETENEAEIEPEVLDLSNSSIEDLAVTLSGLMHNPNLPKMIKVCLADNLNSLHIDYHTSENILGNLKKLQTFENRSNELSEAENG